MNAQIYSLQEQVNHLYASLEALRNGQPFPIPNHSQDPYPIHPALAHPDPYRNNLPPPPQPQDTHPRYQGATSSAFSFDVARSSLQTMGITAPDIQDDAFDGDGAPTLSSPHQPRAPLAPMTIHPNKDPLWKISKEEAIRLCRVYEEEMGLMYPHINMEKVLGQVNSLYKFTEAAARSGLVNPFKSGPDRLGNDDIYILKMILASSLVIEGEGHSDMARELYESCREATEARMLGPVEINGLILLTLVVSGPEQRVRYCTEAFPRPSIISKKTRKSLRTAYLVSPPVNVLRLVFIVARAYSKGFPMMRNDLGLSDFFGRFMCSIGDGVLALVCLSLCKTLTLIRFFLNQ